MAVLERWAICFREHAYTLGSWECFLYRVILTLYDPGYSPLLLPLWFFTAAAKEWSEATKNNTEQPDPHVLTRHSWKKRQHHGLIMGMQNTRTTLICRMEMGGMERIRAATLTNQPIFCFVSAPTLAFDLHLWLKWYSGPQERKCYSITTCRCLYWHKPHSKMTYSCVLGHETPGKW